MMDAPPVVIQYDAGGSVAAYVMYVMQLYQRDVRVVIDGDCFSACTLVLALPPSRVCVTPRARLHFHAASANGVTSQFATAWIWRQYPQKIRDALDGLSEDWQTLEGDDLVGRIRSCA